MKPCKYLDYENNYIDCKIKVLTDFDPPVKHWVRGPRWTEGEENEGNPKNVQFCKKRGRINDVFSCYNGEHSCYTIGRAE